jgi:hypothetical protein
MDGMDIVRAYFAIGFRLMVQAFFLSAVTTSLVIAVLPHSNLPYMMWFFSSVVVWVHNRKRINSVLDSAQDYYANSPELDELLKDYLDP